MNSKKTYDGHKEELLSILNNTSLTASQKFEQFNVLELIQDTEIYQAELLAQNQELLDKESQLSKSREEFETLYNLAPIAYFKLDAKYNILKFNQFATKMFKEFKLQMFKDQPFGIFIDSTDILSFIDLQKKVAENGYASGIIVFKENNKFIGHVNISKNNDEFFVSIIDVTNEKKQEALILAQAKKAAMGEMLSMITHQWKQPISVISFLNSAIVYEVEDNNISGEKLLEYSKDIKEQLEYMSQTIDDFKEYFKSDKQKRSIDINYCIGRAIRFTQPVLKKHEIALTVNFTDLGNNTIMSFPNDFCQVLMNIINNAKDELIKLPPHIQRIISIDISHEDSHIVFRIKNNGGIIPDQIIRQIFNYNFTTKDASGGSGIGLYIVELIVKEHLEGTIEVENIIEEDSVVFTIKIPFIVN